MNRFVLLTLCALSLACREKPGPGQPSPARAGASAAAPGLLAQEKVRQERARQAADEAAARCLSRIRGRGGAGDDGPPSDDGAAQERAELLGRARAEPVFFLSRPELLEAVTPVAELWRRSLEQRVSWGSFERMVRKFSKEPAVLRQIVLTGGYLYTEDPGLALLYTSYLTLPALFREPVLRLERGRQIFKIVRTQTGYEIADGPEQGQRATLILYDRVWIDGQQPPPRRHVSVRELAEELGSDEIAIEAPGEPELVARIRYGKTWIPALLEVRDGRLELGCEAVRGELREQVEGARDERRRLQRAVEPLMSVIREQVDEGLPFDEPKTEDGQQDGKLRPEWRIAYRHGRSQYEFNGDRYWVFDRDGRPHVPQVCIDFIADTFERASGTWWRPRGEARERVVGRLDFDDLALENKRSVEQFLAFAQAHPQWFEVRQLEGEERVSLRNRGRFFTALFQSRMDYRPGDIVVILGKRDDDKLHYHSFFVYEVDPLSGMPVLLAANAGRPRIRTWEGEMQNAPARSILARIRPQLPWLSAVTTPPSVAVQDTLAPPPG